MYKGGRRTRRRGGKQTAGKNGGKRKPGICHTLYPSASKGSRRHGRKMCLFNN